MKKIFISSSYLDLIQERNESIDTVDRISDAKAIAMERFSADPNPTKHVCLENLEKCDAVILILGFKYGSIDSEENLSLTEIEYNTAKALNLPIFVFIKTNDRDNWEPDEKDEKNELLISFKKRLDKVIDRETFKEVHELGKKIPLAIHNYELKNGEIGILNPPFQSGEDFFKFYLNSENYFNHLYPFIGRDEILNKIKESVNSEKQILIISGRGGIGKSKILFEFYSQFVVPDREYELKFLRENALITDDSLRQLSTRNKYIIVIDDAHHSDLSPILAIANQHPENIKLILSCRPYGVNYIKSQLNRFNFDPNGIDHLKINDLNQADLEKLGLSVLGEDHKHFLDSLVQVAQNSPLVLVIGGRLIREKSISPEMLERHEDFQNLVFTRFEDVIIGKIGDRIEEKLCKELLMLISALSPIHINDKRFTDAASNFLNIEKHQLIDTIGVLESAEILSRRGYSLRITPDVLSDHILHNACVTNQGDLTGYAENIIKFFWKISPENLMTNLSELDWRIEKNGLSIDLLDQIWTIIEKSFKEGSNYQRVKMLDLIKRIAHFQPSRSLELVEYAIQNPYAVDKEIEDFETTNDEVIYSLANVLQRISYNLDYLPRCCDILWNLGKDKEVILQSETGHPIRILIDIAEYGIKKPIIIQKIILDAIEKWLQNPNSHEHIHSPLDVLDPILKKEGDSTIFKNYQLISTPFLVNYENVKVIRNKAISILNDLINSKSIKVENRVLKSLIGALRPPVPLYGIAISEEQYKQWIPEQMEILEIIENIVRRTENPIVHIQVASDLKLCSKWNKFGDIAIKIDSILKSIPDSFDLRLTKALVNKFDVDWGNYETEQKRIEEIIQRTAVEFSERFMDVKSAFTYLNEKLEDLTDCKMYIDPGRFLYNLGKINPYISIEISENLFSHPFLPLSNYISSLLSGIRESDKDKALELMKLGIKTNYKAICSGIAFGYSRGWWGSKLNDEDLEIITNLLKISDKTVKGYAIASLARFSDTALKNQVIKLAIDIDISDDCELADDLCSIFQPRSGIDIADLKTDEIEKILSKLEGVTTLESNVHGRGLWICNFLNLCSEKIPDKVIELLIKRIDIANRTRIDTSHKYYQPLPHLEFHNCLKGIFSSPNYKSILRKVRDRIICNERDIFWIPLLFSEISKNYSPESLEILNEWIDTGDKDKIIGVGFLIRKAPTDFVFDNAEFVSKLIETSYNISTECYYSISESLNCEEGSEAKSGIFGEPFPIDVKLRDLGLKYAEKYQKGSPTERFYYSLSKSARKTIEHDLKWEEEMLDEQ